MMEKQKYKKKNYMMENQKYLKKKKQDKCWRSRNIKIIIINVGE